MKFQTNVPEPFQYKDEYEDKLKEGLPVGLSDSQVNLGKHDNILFLQPLTSSFHYLGQSRSSVKYGYSS